MENLYVKTFFIFADPAVLKFQFFSSELILLRKASSEHVVYIYIRFNLCSRSLRLSASIRFRSFPFFPGNP